jgi:hypothetical protein
MLYNDPPSGLQECDPSTTATRNAEGIPNGTIYNLPSFTDLDDLKNDQNYQEIAKVCFEARERAVNATPNKQPFAKVNEKERLSQTVYRQAAVGSSRPVTHSPCWRRERE